MQKELLEIEVAVANTLCALKFMQEGLFDIAEISYATGEKAKHTYREALLNASYAVATIVAGCDATYEQICDLSMKIAHKKN